MRGMNSKAQPRPFRGHWAIATATLISGMTFWLGCTPADESAEEDPVAEAPSADPNQDEAVPGVDAAALASRALSILGTLPLEVPNPENPSTEAKIDLGRMLYYEPRLSKNYDISCNSCHLLDAFGVDGQPNSPGHRGQRGDRNSPTVYNAALHVSQFWDGREPDVEAQAKGPVLNPIEMAAPSEDHVVNVLASIPGYVAAFQAAFPNDPNADEAVTYDNMARAIGVFERDLLTPGRLDAFMSGDLDALSETELRGLETFLGVGCNSCHNGPAIGGGLYRKLGFIFPYETEDKGRENVTGEPADRHVFKVPSLRNVAETGPYFHDGSITELAEVVRIMGYHQVGITLTDEQISNLVAFLGVLTGEIDSEYTAKPMLPESGPNTPGPDPG